jgi:hypothetical protein
MLNKGLRRSFIVVMRFCLLLCLVFIATKCFSQDKTIAGIVFDKESKARVASVSVHNITTGIEIYNNLKGEFKVLAKPGDKIIFSRPEYHPDTITIQDTKELAIYMVRTAIQLKEVTVHDTILTPEQQLEATKREYSKAYGSLAYSDFLSTPSSGGAGLSIDALWNALSRSGRNAEHLRQTIQQDYEQHAIDYRFNRTYVGMITGLKDDRLTWFMQRYRPGYYTTKTASEYEFISMIKANYRRFIRNPRRPIALPPLVTK